MRLKLIEFAIKDMIGQRLDYSDFDQNDSLKELEREKDMVYKQKNNIATKYNSGFFLKYRESKDEDGKKLDNRTTWFITPFNNDYKKYIDEDKKEKQNMWMPYTPNGDFLDRIEKEWLMNSYVYFVNPKFVRDIMQFKEECQAVLKTIKTSEEEKVFQNILKSHHYFVKFYDFIIFELEWRWYQTTTKRKKEEVYGARSGYSITEDKIDQAIKLLYKLGFTNDKIFDKFVHAAKQYIKKEQHVHRHEATIIVLKKCRELTNDPLLKANICQTNAYLYNIDTDCTSSDKRKVDRIFNEYHGKACSELIDALKYYQEVGDADAACQIIYTMRQMHEKKKNETIAEILKDQNEYKNLPRSKKKQYDNHATKFVECEYEAHEFYALLWEV